MGMHPNLKWMLPTLVVVMLTVVFLLSSEDLHFVEPKPPMVIVTNTVESVPGFLIHTSGCRIPYMSAFSPNIRKYIKPAPDIACSTVEPLILSNQTSIFINQKGLQDQNFTEQDIRCCYKPIRRKILKKKTKKVNPDVDIDVGKECTCFESSAVIYDEFIKVICYQNNNSFYEDYHAFIVPKKPKLFNKEDRLRTQKPSILVIGVDAVSRLNFYRQMPLTQKFLQAKEAIDLLGYNKVDDNTFPNLVPVLTGKSVEELKTICWKNDDTYFDECPFIWKTFGEKGYQTSFGEDACWMGIFQYLKKGFFNQPVDNYLQTMMSPAEKDIGHHSYGNAKLCVGPRLAAQVLFQHAEKFAANLTDSKIPYFGFYWSASLTHDYLNVQPQTDVTYHTLLTNLYEKNVMNNTIVIFMSDHGMRWGPIRETYQGRIEERLPLVYFLFPQWFYDAYPTAISNLKRNRKMLTSPFDLHETLIDLLSTSSLEPSILENRKRNQVSKRGISLFLQIPDQRTCEDAGIAENWCTCHQSQNISLSDPIVRKSSLAVVDHLNQMLFPYIQCEQLSLFEVKSAMLESPRAQVKSSSRRSMQDITVVIETKPGLAEFEATVRRNLDSDVFEVLGYVSRINAYGDQSKCVDNYQMRLYCYCRDSIL